jgi:hypothetical protein
MTGEAHTGDLNADRRPDVEPRQEEPPRGLIARVVLVTVMVGVTLCFSTYLLLRARTLGLRPSGLFPERDLGAPRAISGVEEEQFRVRYPRPTLRDEQRAVLESYGWVDRARGIVRIPITRAMEIVAAEGTR